MTSVTLRVPQPQENQRILLGAWPIESEPVALRALLFNGQDDVTRHATFTWKLSWKATYRTYVRTIAFGATANVKFVTGGGLLRVFALYDGQTHQGSVRVDIVGQNPTLTQVAKKIGPDDLLRAICWRESTDWRQFNSHGKPLQPRIGKRRFGSARGVAQVKEIPWGGSEEIEHNDYPRIAWQWDYCIDTARDILTYTTRKARKKFPAETDPRFTDRVVKAYHLGEGSFNTAEDPTKFDYVVAVRKFMAQKPWEK